MSSAQALPARVRMVEVGPRDGLQNEPIPATVEARIGLIERLADAGLPTIEAGSFVSPKWIPQMADTDRVLAGLRPREDIRYAVLVPNMKGLESALAAGARHVAVFASATEAFSRANINSSIAESLERYAEVAARALAEGLTVRGYVSCTLGCPFEGEVTHEAVAHVVGALVDMGCFEVSLGDTIGVGTPAKAAAMVGAVAERVPVEKLAVHFHDTYGQALANTYAALQAGVSVIDSSVAGLGGCPYAPGASGNLASEDVLYMLEGLGVETGVDLAKLVEAGAFISRHFGRLPRSKAALALAAQTTD